MIKEIFIIFDSLSTDVAQFDFPAEHMENVGKFTTKLYSQNSIFTSVGESIKLRSHRTPTKDVMARTS